MEDKYSAQKKYAKNNIKKLSCSFQGTFVDEFRSACLKLNLKQSNIIRKAMQEIIDKAKEMK